MESYAVENIARHKKSALRLSDPVFLFSFRNIGIGANEPVKLLSRHGMIAALVALIPALLALHAGLAQPGKDRGFFEERLRRSAVQELGDLEIRLPVLGTSMSCR